MRVLVGRRRRTSQLDSLNDKVLCCGVMVVAVVSRLWERGRWGEKKIIEIAEEFDESRLQPNVSCRGLSVF